MSDEGRREPGTPLPGVNGIPGPNALDEDVWDQRTPEQMATDWERAHRPTPPGPPDPAALEQRAHRAVDAVGGVGHVDPWDEPEPARRDLYDRTAWIERLAWRNAFLTMFMLGVFAFAFQYLAWPYAAALALGGLVPGLFLMAREQVERNVEADRAMNRPETRHDGTLPPLRRTVRSFNDGIDE